ncbi:MAG: hypothetical protein LQ340_005299 [Diploschistes diacapsis]|nr:MAG: hypothetical protein LQ340_005299 [Diploschistes diacapsis]
MSPIALEFLQTANNTTRTGLLPTTPATQATSSSLRPATEIIHKRCHGTGSYRDQEKKNKKPKAATSGMRNIEDNATTTDSEPVPGQALEIASETAFGTPPGTPTTIPLEDCHTARESQQDPPP